MKGLGLSRCALAMGAASLLLTGCGGAQPPIGGPGTMPQVIRTTSAAYRVFYEFTRNAGLDGVGPLINVNGTFYGTTFGGGTSKEGTLYRLSAAGKVKCCTVFLGRLRRVGPVGSLISVQGTMYGATFGGGTCGQGTVYGMTVSGTEKLLHSSVPLPPVSNLKPG